MKRCPNCGGNVATWCNQCTFCNTVISEYVPQSSKEQNQNKTTATTTHLKRVYIETSPLGVEKNNHTVLTHSKEISYKSNGYLSGNSELEQKVKIDSKSRKKEQTSDLWIYVCLVIVTCVFMVKTGILNFCFSLSDSFGGLILAVLATLFVGAVLFEIFLGISIIVFLPFRSLWSRHMCPHGVWNGTKRVENGKQKCFKCQLEWEKKIEREIQEFIENQQAKEYQRRFTCNLAMAIKKRKDSLVFDDDAIHSMPPQAFEDMVAALFRKIGYQVQQTPYTNDGGKDAILYKDGKKYLVECKRYKSDAAIGRPMMQKLHAAMVEERAAGGFFVASCRYTQDALDYGKKFKIKTVDRVQLLDMFEKTKDSTPESRRYNLSCRHCGEYVSFDMWNGEKQKICPNGHEIQNVFFYHSGKVPICLKCGSLMKIVHSSSGNYYSCLNYFRISKEANDSWGPKCTYQIAEKEYWQEIEKCANEMDENRN